LYPMDGSLPALGGNPQYVVMSHTTG